jgi:VanZ family protein
MSERLLVAPRVVPPWRWWLGFGVVVALATMMSALAYTDRIPTAFVRVFQYDKGVHFATAGMLAFFLDGALRRRKAFAASGHALPLAAVIILVPAAIEEYLQRYSQYRTSSIWDFAADLAGVAVLIPLSRLAAR